MSYQPPYTVTPKITHLVAQISEAVGGYYAQVNLRLHRANRIKTMAPWRSREIRFRPSR